MFRNLVEGEEWMLQEVWTRLRLPCRVDLCLRHHLEYPIAMNPKNCFAQLKRSGFKDWLMAISLY